MTSEAKFIADHECPICGCIVSSGFSHEIDCGEMARAELYRYWRKYGRPRNKLEWMKFDREELR